jgi:hypothetical protein
VPKQSKSPLTDSAGVAVLRAADGLRVRLSSHVGFHCRLARNRAVAGP